MLFWFVSAMMAEVYFSIRKESIFPLIFWQIFFMWSQACSKENKLLVPVAFVII